MGVRVYSDVLIARVRRARDGAGWRVMWMARLVAAGGWLACGGAGRYTTGRQVEAAMFVGRTKPCMCDVSTRLGPQPWPGPPTRPRCDDRRHGDGLGGGRRRTTAARHADASLAFISRSLTYTNTRRQHFPLPPGVRPGVPDRTCTVDTFRVPLTPTSRCQRVRTVTRTYSPRTRCR